MRIGRTIDLAGRFAAHLPAWLLARGTRSLGHRREYGREIARQALAPSDLHTLWKRRAPVVLTGFLDHFELSRLLQPEIMKRAWGVTRTVTYRAPRDQKAFLQERSRPVFMDYDRLVDRIFFEKDPRFRYYSRMGAHPGSLFELASCIPSKELAHVAIWIGEEENITPFHFDTFHSFIGQTFGEKRVVLVPPEDGIHLRYRTLPFSRQANQVGPCELPDDVRGLEAVDRRYSLARRFDVVLGPGDFLYIPPGWWHWVVALTPNVSVLLRQHAAKREALRTPETLHYVWRELLGEIGLAPAASAPAWDETEVWSANEIRRLQAAEAELEAR
ncbi:MAG TPA: cupin-like domain-containing protein [Kofleriaceae bacterium]|nr:cupin-like domain-containing protein [Kofleriaceae bacterium]